MSRGESNGDDDNLSNSRTLFDGGPVQPHSASSDAGDLSVNGDEGIEEHHVGDLGDHNVNTVIGWLAKHGRLSLFSAVDDGYPNGSLLSRQTSRAMSPSSTEVDMSSEEHSITQSTTFSVRSFDPDEMLRFAGAGFERNAVVAPDLTSHFGNGGPLMLNHEQGFCRNLEIGMGADLPRYPPELGDFRNYDMW